MRRLWSVVAPLIVSSLALRVYDRLDLVTLTAVGGSPEQAGHYGAAQNLAILPSIVGVSFAPLLLATLTHAFRDGQQAAVRRIGGQAMRWVVLLTPLAALCAGASRGIVHLVFGPEFRPTAPLIAPLLFSAIALVMIAVSTSILIAAGRPGLTAAFTAPMPALAGLGYLMVIPRYGLPGASMVTLLVSVAAAVALGATVFRVCRVHPPPATVLRSALVCVAVYGAAVLWSPSGTLVLVEIAALAAASLLALACMGEFTPAERSALMGWWKRGPRPAT